MAKRPELRSYQAPPLTDDDEHTQILPSSLRSAAMLSHAQGSRPARPLLDFTSHDADDEATGMFDSGQLGARDPAPDYHTVPTTAAQRNTLSRNPAAVEDDIQARAQLARDTGENATTARRRHVQAAHTAHAGAELPRASTPAPADAALLPSRRPQRSATSTASAFQRTQAEPSSAFPPSMHSAPSPVPSTAASLPAATYGISGEQIAALVSTPPRRRPASWFAALGAAVAVVVLGSTVLLRNPSTALAASALADPTGTAAGTPPPLSADAPLTAPLPVAEVPTPVAAPPPVAEEPTPVYVPGFAETAEPSESPDVAPVAVPDAPPARRAGAAPATPKKSEAPKPKPQKVAPPPKKVAAAKPAAEPTKKKAKADQSDEERRASEEAKRLAQKQLEDQL